MGFACSTFELDMRRRFPNSWIAINGLVEGRRRNIEFGNVIAVSNDIRSLDVFFASEAGNGLEGVEIISPTEYYNMHWNRTDAIIRYCEWRRSIARYLIDIECSILKCHYLLCRLFYRPYYAGKEGAYLFWLRDRFVRRLHSVDGFFRTLVLTGSDNLAVAGGAFQELTRLYGMTMRSLSVAAVGKIIVVPPLGKTDIDVLTDDGLWCESKRVRRGLCLDAKLKLKLDKMALARDNGLKVVVNNTEIKITRLLLSSSRGISKSAIDYAHAIGIEVQENSVYGYRPY